ncbi:GGDEF domain-containing protein [Motilibacter deserti]
MQTVRGLLASLLRVQHPDPDVRRRGRVLVALCSSVSVIALVLAPIVAQLSDASSGLWTLALTSAAYLGVVPLARRGHVGIASAAVVCTFGTIIAGIVHVTNAQLSPVYCSVIVLVGGLVVRVRAVPLVLLATVGLILALPHISGDGTRPSSYDDVAVAGVLMSVVAAFAAFLTSRIVSTLLREAETARLQAADLAARLSEVNGQLEARVAARTEELEDALRRSRVLAGQLEGMTRRDFLTGLGNRRELDAALRAIDSRREPPHSISLAVCDIDDFKTVNDRFGHPAGDEVLRRVATTLDRGRRAGDLVVRLGGEEFVLLLPGAEQGQAAEACERLRAAVAALDLDDVSPGLRVTMSVGVATGGPGPAHPRLGALLGTADAHLYEAKRAGKDRVVTGKLDTGRPAIVA